MVCQSLRRGFGYGELVSIVRIKTGLEISDGFEDSSRHLERADNLSACFWVATWPVFGFGPNPRARVMGRSMKSKILRKLVIASCVSVMSLMWCSGCTTLDLRGQSPEPNDLSILARQARPADPTLEPFTFSNKARAIEANLGVGNGTATNRQF